MSIPLLHDGLPASSAADINAAIAATVPEAISQADARYHQRISNYAALRAVYPVNPAAIYLDGGASENDGAQGIFIASAVGTTGQYVDNGDTVIVPTGGDGSAAWLRVSVPVTHGTTAQRPASPALWQMYGDDTLGQPIWATTITPSVIWTNSAGGVV
ncbi:hypothetical protein [Acidovorax sp. 16-64-162]|uniref:hypothetical protein n=1 Tax=Acidovorax sp. 16-64-162 TaxID=1970307 RepID=UPI0025C0E205|nr:hypothetical protein [Acidovorax sp. 16-64-162]